MPRVPTYRTSTTMLEPKLCCTPRVQSIDLGSFWLTGTNAEVAARWSAMVGKVAIPPGPGKIPPLPRKPAGLLQLKAPTGAQSIVDDSCGGKESKPRLSNSTS